MSDSSAGLNLLSSLWFNTLLSVVFLICYALLKNQPLNFRVYFPRLYMRGDSARIKEYVDKYGGDPGSGRLSGYLNLSWRSYLRSFNWIWYALKETEAELIQDVGLDSTVFVRIFLLGLKIFVPMLVWGCAVLIPVNKTDGYLSQFQETHQNLTDSDVTYSNGPESLSIANVEDLSKRLWAHLLAAYLFTIWTCLMLYLEYATVERMRLEFLASQTRRPDQFTVLVRQVPKDDTESVGLRIQHFFREIHSEHYVTHQVVYKAKRLTKLLKEKNKYQRKLDRWEDQFGREPSTPRPTVRKRWFLLGGERRDAIEFYREEIERLALEIKAERKKVLEDESYVMRAGFVSFDSRWGAAVCAQTQQTRDQTKWITEWAPEPRDVYWNNLAIRYMLLNSRRLIVTVVVTVLVLFFLIAVGAVQVLANLQELIRYMPFLKPLSRWKYVEAFISGFLPALILKIFLLIIPYLLKTLTKFEGHVSYSRIEKYTAIKYFAFLVVNVFFGNVLLGSLFDQLKQYIAAPPSIPKAFGVSIPKKATFFMTYIMIDGWTSIAAEVMRLWPLLWYHIKSALFVRTDKERVKVIPAMPANYFIVLPRLSLYILLGLVYAVISPLILPFLCVFFAFGFLIYRNQVINVYQPKYESAAAFWPNIHRNVIIALIIKHITLIGLFSVKKAFASTPFLVPLPIGTIMFHLFCSEKFYPAFHNYPLQEAKIKDEQEPLGDDKEFLETAYVHPSIVDSHQDSDSDDDPDRVKNGTAPGEGPSNQGEKKFAPTPRNSPPQTPKKNPSRYPPQNPNGLLDLTQNNSSSRRRSQRWNNPGSPGSQVGSHSGSHAFYDPGSHLSTPVLSRTSSSTRGVHVDGSSSLHSLPREEIALGSGRNSPSHGGHGGHGHVEEIDVARRHLNRLEDGGGGGGALGHGRNEWDGALRREGWSDMVPEREVKGDGGRKESFTGMVHEPLGHAEP